MRIQASAPDRFAYRPRQEPAPEASAATPRRRRRPPAQAEPSREAEPEQPAAGPRAPGDLDDKQKAEVMRLQQRDAEVRAHEAAHAAAAGMLGGGASYDYVTGPDGRQYAVGGEVPVRISAGQHARGGDPQRRAGARRRPGPGRTVRSGSCGRRAGRGHRGRRPGRAGGISRRRSSEVARRRPDAHTARRDQGTAPRRRRRRADAVRVDPEETARQLEAEQRSTRGSWRHMHLSSGCGSCSAAAARYV